MNGIAKAAIVVIPIGLVTGGLLFSGKLENATGATANSSGIPSDSFVIDAFIKGLAKNYAEGDNEKGRVSTDAYYACTDKVSHTLYVKPTGTPGVQTVAPELEKQARNACMQQLDQRLSIDLASNVEGYRKGYNFGVVSKRTTGYFTVTVDIRMADKSDGKQSFWRETLQNDGKQWSMTQIDQIEQ